jgi:hypothetical protein
MPGGGGLDAAEPSESNFCIKKTICVENAKLCELLDSSRVVIGDVHGSIFASGFDPPPFSLSFFLVTATRQKWYFRSWPCLPTGLGYALQVVTPGRKLIGQYDARAIMTPSARDGPKVT